jgi:hypothetical protein
MLLPVSADDLGHTVYLLLRRMMGAYVILCHIQCARWRICFTGLNGINVSSRMNKTPNKFSSDSENNTIK